MRKLKLAMIAAALGAVTGASTTQAATTTQTIITQTIDPISLQIGGSTNHFYEFVYPVDGWIASASIAGSINLSGQNLSLGIKADGWPIVSRSLVSTAINQNWNYKVFNLSMASDGNLNFFVNLSGDAGTAILGTTTLTVTTEAFLAVPGPIAGAGLPALLALGGFVWARRRKTAVPAAA